MLKYKMVILKSFFIALLFSSSIYFEYFNIGNIFINSITGLVSIYFLLTMSKKELFFIGFFIGLLWFWWIGYSFIYYDLIYLIPIILIFIGIIYGLLFYLSAIYPHIIYRTFAIFSLSFIHPFGFNWFKPEVIFINSFFGIEKLDFLIIITTLALFIYYKRVYILTLLLFAISYTQTIIELPNIKIYQPQYNISQETKWLKSYRDVLIEENLNNIDYAIKNDFELVILPETIFPLPLNKNIPLINILKNKSKKTTIITGALEFENNQYFNTTYMFKNGNIKIARKVVLVPFGESIPLPKILRDLINAYFYNGARDYSVALEPTTFNINGINFRNAICYEATTDKIFNKLDTSFIIATSNNAWFTPSIEPTLQNLLLKYYAKKYNVIIYHSSNSSKNKIIQ
ncbi:MAG: apolipoprotein N-acyltransferase [Campylobacteraceae bacterium]|nr:apolipoprotein N-acyltransferase [Campylobacteraceae bacterium]MBT3881913.1 apolipoprotein N-acyltransferase [Campylobacteraceae bacterium]MBT4030779.1 apolipoprotein N-acyltransferase [Campylobacteraceae bacterium]MBT4178730.1 apolipoprotein N-acyltransferase [Campylobacteraceae bacterium]MBT4572093.1 apolipoprotein N-acyltransferase [Campylobacteraceae bacterium]